ncbi:hypothetical protein, partial [Rhodopseudomonas sp. BAL398]|uniref:hypothetical protein n=1 Tax=Rhodopseudomonas sp. BAL398 TaxID=3034676 RepID=UPI0023E2710F
MVAAGADRAIDIGRARHPRRHRGRPRGGGFARARVAPRGAPRCPRGPNRGGGGGGAGPGGRGGGGGGG